MGYDVHITRKDDWSDAEGPEISIAEWLAVVEADPEMRLDRFAETRLSVWTAYSQHDESGNKAWFLHHDGRVTVKNPDDEILRKMWSIAQTLSAKVQGDDMEIYDSSARESHQE